MPTPLRESILAAVAARLAAQIPAVPVERARRAPVEIAQMPRLVVRGQEATPDEGQSPGETFWTFGFTVTGYAKGTTDLAAEQALSQLHADVMAALQMAALGPASVMPSVGPADMRIYEPEMSAVPAGEFTVAFAALAVAPTASPYAP